MDLKAKARTAWALFGPPRPFVLFHKPTARCDCRCRFCDSWVDQPEEKDELASETILPFIDQARAAGMTTYTVWGGEPFMVEALPAWLGRARGHGMQTVVCTSGYRLSDRAADMGPHIERLLLSLESVGEKQDKIRRTPGLFSRMVQGIEKYQELGFKGIRLWSNLSRENMDQVEEIARFARDYNIGVEFFPAAAYPGYNDDMVMGPSERGEAFAKALDLKRRGFPVINTRYGLELMRSGRRFECNVPRLSVQLDAEGVLHPCEARVIPDLNAYGTIFDVDLESLVRSDLYRQEFTRLSSCNACLLPCVANMADGIIAQGLRKAASDFYYRRLC